jgi:hypothetical protein
MQLGISCAPRPSPFLEARRVQPLRHARPLWQFCHLHQPTSHTSRNDPREKRLTVYALPVVLLVPSEHGVLVLGPHLRLSRHLGLPPLRGLAAQPLPCERAVDDGDDAVDVAEALAVAGLALAGHAPGGFPCGDRLAGGVGRAWEGLPEEASEEGVCGAE